MVVFSTSILGLIPFGQLTLVEEDGCILNLYLRSHSYSYSGFTHHYLDFTSLLFRFYSHSHSGFTSILIRILLPFSFRFYSHSNLGFTPTLIHVAFLFLFKFYPIIIWVSLSFLFRFYPIIIRILLPLLFEFQSHSYSGFIPSLFRFHSYSHLGFTSTLIWGLLPLLFRFHSHSYPDFISTIIWVLCSFLFRFFSLLFRFYSHSHLDLIPTWLPDSQSTKTIAKLVDLHSTNLWWWLKETWQSIELGYQKKTNCKVTWAKETCQPTVVFIGYWLPNGLRNLSSWITYSTGPRRNIWLKLYFWLRIGKYHYRQSEISINKRVFSYIWKDSYKDRPNPRGFMQKLD